MSIAKTVNSFFAKLDPTQPVDGDATPWPPLVVGVSGGPDSMALLHALVRRGAYPADKIVVAHLNHMIRPGATSDAAHVRSVAEEWQVTFRLGEVDVAGMARKEGLSLEAAGRKARYEFLAAVARDNRASAVATGHNQNDQAETVLMNLLRGSGLTGLRGMRPEAPLPGAPELTLLRPLLTVDRETIEAYCRRMDLAFVEDESNRDVTLFRNRLRYQLLPELVDYNPQIAAHLSNLASVVGADEELLADLLENAWARIVIEAGPARINLDLKRWRAMPLAMRRRSLRRAVALARADQRDIGFETTELARKVADEGETGDQVTLPGNVKLLIRYGQLLITGAGQPLEKSAWPRLMDDSGLALPVPGRLLLDERWVLRVTREQGLSFEHISGNRDPWRAYIKAEFADDLWIRPRLPGERFRPLGMTGKSTKVSDAMTDRKIPAELRGRWPIIACRDHLLWIVGHSTDDRAQILPEDEEVLLLQVERLQAVDEL